MGFREDTAVETVLGEYGQTETGPALACLVGIGMNEVSVSLNNLQSFLSGIKIWNIGSTDNAGINSGVPQFNGDNLLSPNGTGYLRDVSERLLANGVGGAGLQPQVIQWISSHTGPGEGTDMTPGNANVQNSPGINELLNSNDPAAVASANWLNANITNGDRCILLQCTVERWAGTYYNAALSKFLQINNEVENSFFVLYLLCDIANQYGTGALNWFTTNPTTGLLVWNPGVHNNETPNPLLSSYNSNNIPFRNDSPEIQSIINSLSDRIDNEWSLGNNGVNLGFVNAMRLMCWRWANLRQTGNPDASVGRTRESLRYLQSCIAGGLSGFVSSAIESVGTPTNPCNIDFAGAGQIPDTTPDVTLVNPEQLINAMFASENRELPNISAAAENVMVSSYDAPGRLLHDYEHVRILEEHAVDFAAGFTGIPTELIAPGSLTTVEGGSDAPFLSMNTPSILTFGSIAISKYPPYATMMGHFLSMKIAQGIDRVLETKVGSGGKEDIYKYFGIHYCFTPCRTRNSPCPFQGSHADDHVSASNDNPFGAGAIDFKINTERFYNAADQILAMPNFFDIYIDSTSNRVHANIISLYLLVSVFKTLCSACEYSYAVIIPNQDPTDLSKPAYHDFLPINPDLVGIDTRVCGHEFGFDVTTRGVISWISDLFGDNDVAWTMRNGSRVKYKDDCYGGGLPGEYELAEGSGVTEIFNKEFNVMIYIPQNLLDAMEEMGHFNMRWSHKATHGLIIMNTATTHDPSKIGQLHREFGTTPDALYIPDAIYLFPDKSLGDKPIMHVSNRRDAIFKGLYEGERKAYSCTSKVTGRLDLDDNYDIPLSNFLPIRDRHHYFSGFTATYHPRGEMLSRDLELPPMSYLPGIFASFILPIKNTGSTYYGKGYIRSADYNMLFPPDYDMEARARHMLYVYHNNDVQYGLTDEVYQECTDKSSILIKPNTAYHNMYNETYFYLTDRLRDVEIFPHVLKNNLAWRVHGAQVTPDYVYEWSNVFSSRSNALYIRENMTYLMGSENFEPILVGAYRSPRSETVDEINGVVKLRYDEDLLQYPMCWFFTMLDGLFPIEGYPNNTDPDIENVVRDDTDHLKFSPTFYSIPASEIVGIEIDSQYHLLWGTDYASRLIGVSTYEMGRVNAGYPDYVLSCGDINHFSRRYWLGDRNLSYPTRPPQRLVGSETYYGEGYFVEPEPEPDSDLGISVPLRSFMNVYTDAIWKLTRITSARFLEENGFTADFSMHFMPLFVRGILGKESGEHCGFRFPEQYYKDSEYYTSDGVSFDVKAMFGSVLGEPEDLLSGDNMSMSGEVQLQYDYALYIADERDELVKESYESMFVLYTRALLLMTEIAYLEELIAIDPSFVSRTNDYVYTVNGETWNPHLSTHIYTELSKSLFNVYYWDMMNQYKDRLGTRRVNETTEYPLFRDISIENIYRVSRNISESYLHMHIPMYYLMGPIASDAGIALSENVEEEIGDDDYETRYIKKSYQNYMEDLYHRNHPDRGLVVTASIGSDNRTNMVLVGKMGTSVDGPVETVQFDTIREIILREVGISSSFEMNADTLRSQNYIFSDDNFMKHMEVLAKEIAISNETSVEESRIRSKLATLVASRVIFGTITNNTTRDGTPGRVDEILTELINPSTEDPEHYRSMTASIFSCLRSFNGFRVVGITSKDEIKKKMWRMGWKEEYTEVSNLEIGMNINDNITEDIKWNMVIPGTYASARDIPEGVRNNLIDTCRAAQEIMDGIRSNVSNDIIFAINSGWRPNDGGSHHSDGRALDMQISTTMQTRDDIKGWPFCILGIIDADTERTEYTATRVYWEWTPNSGGDGWLHIEANTAIRSYGNTRGTTREIRLGVPKWNAVDNTWVLDNNGNNVMTYPHYVHSPPPGNDTYGAPWRPSSNLPAYGEEVTPC